MQTKTLMWILVAVFSTIGAYLPLVWGGSVLDIWSMILSAAGAVLGIWLVFKTQGY